MQQANSSLSAKDLAERLASSTPPRLLDVRQPEEFAIAKLPGAVLIPLGELPTRLPELESWKNGDVPIVIHCHHGMRSLRAIEFLKLQGFRNLINLAGGIDAWSLDVDPKLPRY